jgi:hypothetical protein
MYRPQLSTRRQPGATPNESTSDVRQPTPERRHPNLGRAIAHRWPALLGAVLATAALPAGMALASGDFGPTTFIAGLGQTAVTAVGPVGIEAVGGFVGVSAHSDGLVAVRADSDRGTGLEARVRENGTAVSASADSGFAVKATSNTTAVQGIGGRIGVSASGQTAVSAEGTQVGVRAKGVSTAVEAKSTSTTDDGTAIRAEGGKKANGFGSGVLAIGDEAVVARGTTIGVDATGSNTGVAGIASEGVGGLFAGKEAPIRMLAASTAGAPTTGAHHKGELYVDSQGLLFYCTADGTPGTWKKVHLDN